MPMTEHQKEIERKRYQRDRTKRIALARSVKLRRKYGITAQEYESLFAAQNGVCALCGRPEKNKRLSIDHNHTTRVVRGLLCTRCNRALGSVELAGLDRVSEYLKRGLH